MKPWEKYSEIESKPWERYQSEPILPEITPEIAEQIRANNEAYARRQEENRPWFDKNPAGRLAVATAQGISNSTLNPFGYIARSAGVDTHAFTPENAIERGAELAGEYGYDALALGTAGNIAKGAGYLGKGEGVASRVAQSVLAPENAAQALSTFVAPAVSGGIVEGAVNPESQWGKFAANMVGAFIPGSIEGSVARSGKFIKGGLANAVGETKATKALNSGIRAKEAVAQEVYDAVPQARSKLQEEMIDTLQSSVNHKIDKDLALKNANKRYGDFIAENAEKPLFDVENKEIWDNIGIGGENASNQISRNAENIARAGAEGIEEAEKTSAIRDLVKFGENSKRLNKDGIFLRGDSVRGTDRWIVNPEASGLFDKAKASKISYIQLKQTPEESRRFFNALKNAKKELGAIGEQVWLYSPKEYQNMKLFLSRDGLSGVAVKPDGDIVSVFANPKAKLKDIYGRATGMVELAKQNGGTKLDAFDTFLPKLYERHGFKEIGRDAWNPEIAASDLKNWDKKFFNRWNKGEPDVVYMQLEEPLPLLSKFTEGLNPFQKDALKQAISEGAYMSNQKIGSLDATHKAQSVLNDMINASYDTKQLAPKATTKTKDLMEVKQRFKEILEPSGVKPYDRSIMKAKKLQEAFDLGYKFKPSELKFENLKLGTLREKNAFLQGTIQKILDNVTDETNIARAVKNAETTLRKILPENKFNILMKKARQIDTRMKRLSSLENRAERKLTIDAARKMGWWREFTESLGSIFGGSVDKALDIASRGARSRAARKYLNPSDIVQTIEPMRMRGGLESSSRQGIIDLMNYFNSDGRNLNKQLR